MKSSTKPKSSPARTDDFQPPLIIEASIMFPRTKSNRGSRSRSNSNPLFIRKIDSGHEPNQEPSSPKVSCIGQVRVNRLKNKQTTTAVARRCKWVRKLNPRWFQRLRTRKTRGDHGSRTEQTRTDTRPGPKPNKMKNKNKEPGLFCVFWACLGPVHVSSSVFSGRPVRCLFLEKLVFFGCDCCRKSEKIKEQDGDSVEHEPGDMIGACEDGLVSESGPRNVFLLTRSRSAPCGCSFSGHENWELIRGGEKMVVKEEDEEDEGFINGVERFKKEVVKLSRCKSEPTRTGNKLFMSFSFTT